MKGLKIYYMNNNNKIKRNYFYNLSFQAFKFIIPLVTTPYISRVLGSEGVGQYSFSFSIITYFTLLAAIGFEVYAQREIARYQGDRKEQSKIFWEIFIAKMISSMISLTIYLGLVFFVDFGENYQLLLLILSINIIAVGFDVVYLFQGNEEFGLIALRNIIVKCIGVVLIFIFVKKPSDVWIYTLIQAGIMLISSLSLWTRLTRILVKFKIKDLDFKRHYIPTLKLFIPTIAVSVYTMLDKTLIGVLVPGINDLGQSFSDLENGYYEQAEKIVRMGLSVITSLGAVMIPRNSQAIASGDISGFRKNINGALKFVFFIGVPIMFGLSAIATNFSPWFFGDGYEKVPYLIMMFSPMVVIIGFSNVLGLQYLIPLKKDKNYTVAIISGAVVNLMLNLILIPLFWSYGACIASVSAELVVTSVMFYFARDSISLIELLKKSWKYIVSGIVMFIVVFLSQVNISSSILHTVELISEGIVIYFILLLLFKDELSLSYWHKMKSLCFRISKR